MFLLWWRSPPTVHRARQTLIEIIFSRFVLCICGCIPSFSCSRLSHSQGCLGWKGEEEVALSISYRAHHPSPQRSVQRVVSSSLSFFFSTLTLTPRSDPLSHTHTHTHNRTTQTGQVNASTRQPSVSRQVRASYDQHQIQRRM